MFKLVHICKVEPFLRLSQGTVAGTPVSNFWFATVSSLSTGSVGRCGEIKNDYYQPFPFFCSNDWFFPAWDEHVTPFL